MQADFASNRLFVHGECSPCGIFIVLDQMQLRKLLGIHTMQACARCAHDALPSKRSRHGTRTVNW